MLKCIRANDDDMVILANFLMILGFAGRGANMNRNIFDGSNALSSDPGTVEGDNKLRAATKVTLSLIAFYWSERKFDPCHVLTYLQP